MTDAIVLPDSGDGSRRARRQASGRKPTGRKKRDGGREPRRHSREARQRRRRPFVLLVVAFVLAAGGAVAWNVTRHDGDDTGTGPPSKAPVATTPRTGLLIERTLDGRLGGLTLLVDRGRRGDVVFLPPGTMVEAPSLGLVPLRETLEPGRNDLLVATVENLLGTRVDVGADVTIAQLADAVRPAAPLRVEVPAPVERGAGDRVETVFEAGPADLAPEQVGDFLDLPGKTDLDRLVRHQAFWEAWLAAIRRDPSAGPASGTVPPALRQQLLRLAAGAVEYDVLPVRAVGGAEGLYQVERAQLDDAIGRILPGTRTWAQRITVQVLNGTGKPGVTEPLIGPLVDAGARVALTGNADRFGYTTTQVLYYEDTHADDARKIQAALGIGQVVKSRSAQRVVAVTVVVGADLPSDAAGPTSTTQGARP